MPADGLTGFELPSGSRERQFSQGLAELAKGFSGRSTRNEKVIDGRQRRGRDVLGMDRDQEQAGSVFQRRPSLTPIARQKMMRFVDHDPMRPSRSRAMLL